MNKMNTRGPHVRPVSVALLLAAGWILTACSSDTPPKGGTGTAGDTNAAGAAGQANAGSGGMIANGGVGASSAAGGSTATSGAAGDDGSAGSGGDTSNGGTTGTAGGAGTAGSAGRAGNAGTGGESGSAGGGVTITTLADGLKVSSSFYVHKPPAIVAAGAGEFSGSALGCGPSACLVAYVQHIMGRYLLVGTRVSSAGAVLGRTTLAEFDDVNGYIAGVSVGSNGSGYLVYSSQGRTVSGSQTGIGVLQSIDAAGNVSATRSDIWPQAQSSVVIRGGDGTYLVGSDVDSRYRLFNSHLEQIGATKTFSLTTAIAHGQGRYFIATQSSAITIDEGTGTVSAEQQFWRYPPATAYPVAFEVNGTYVLVGTRQGQGSGFDAYAIRFDANGTLQDPDDTFNQLSGGTRVCQNCDRALQTATTVGSAGVVLATTSTGLSGFRVGLSPFARIGNVTGTEFKESGHVLGQFQLFPNTLLGLEAGALDVFALGTTATPWTIDFSGATIAIPRSKDMTDASVAFNGTRFLVGGSQMVPTFVAENGSLSEVSGLPAGGQVGANGGAFLHARNTSTQIITQTITTTGVLGAPQSLTADHSSYFSDFRLTSNERYYLLTAASSLNASGGATVSGIRLGPDGSFIDQGRGLFSTRGAYAVVADTTPPAAMRTFGIFTQGTSQWLQYRSEAGSLLSPIHYQPALIGPCVASDGTSFLDVYDDSLGQLKYGTLIDPVSGTAGTPVPLADLSLDTLEGVWFDGRAYFVSTAQSSNLTADPFVSFNVKRYTPALAPVDASVSKGYLLLPDKLPPSPEPLRSAHDGNGKSLIVYAFPDANYGGITLKGVFVYDGVNP